MRQSEPNGSLSIQDQYFPDLPCFGCGPANPDGLQLKSYLVDGTVLARFRPRPAHNNGLGYLNGGIIATLLDCHSAALATLTAYQNGWPPLPGADLPYVTAGLDVRYRRPAPLDAEVLLIGTVLAAAEPEITVEVSLEWEGKQRATGTALWKRWRPRNPEF